MKYPNTYILFSILKELQSFIKLLLASTVPCENIFTNFILNIFCVLFCYVVASEKLQNPGKSGKNFKFNISSNSL
jgi:hypothetical protein